MLVAVNEAEQIINLLEFSKSDLTELVGQFLRCPACKSQVRLKNGHVKMPHFAHVNLAACQYYSENESLQHLILKKRLYHWFKQTEQVKIEHFLPELQQTPDLLVNETIAIEIQCSHLSIQRLRERTETYRAHGYTVLWLMGKDLWLGQHLTQLKQQLLYLTQNAGFYYWELDLQREKIRLNYLCHEDLIGRLHYLQREFSFDVGNLLEVLRTPFAASSAKLTDQLSQDIPAFIRSQLYYQNPKWLKIQEKYYQNGQNLMTFKNFPIKLYPIGLNLLTHQFEGVVEPDFCQITSDISRYYHHFLAYPQDDGVYPPGFYARAETGDGDCKS
ncbi:competence protein CoiA [Lactococcus raffinolactis]|uniref:competence protein CoiA n=1 Tax=Pseudolactococcus raffinolactis TaxID=1366 RepID=UPI001436BC0D|nr:competence protein CoiA family protein [Lactococcus raffinolactis]QIW51920.1 competence protein CoiA [Lactococcus raffinolactis]